MNEHGYTPLTKEPICIGDCWECDYFWIPNDFCRYEGSASAIHDLEARGEICG